MSKSAIYTCNNAGATLAAGDVIPVGSTIRRFGCNVKQDGNAITLCGQGYYLINASCTVTPSAAGTVSVTALKDGVAVIGANASVTVAATDTATNLPISAIVRNICNCGNSLLSFSLGGAAAVVNNFAVTVEKL